METKYFVLQKKYQARFRMGNHDKLEDGHNPMKYKQDEIHVHEKISNI